MNHPKGYWITILILVSTIIYGTYIEKQYTSPQMGEAYIRFTDWSGWMVETSNHLLIFDYVELGTDFAERVIENGYITDEVVQNKRVRVFASHIHGDHYQSLIWNWRNLTDDILYFIGWDITPASDIVRMHEHRSNYSDTTIKVSVINKPNSALSEVAYLVIVDGISIYHSGDLVTSNPAMRPEYSENIDYISSLSDTVDLTFIAKAGTWNNTHINTLDLYTIKTINPIIFFPSHAEKGGKKYIDFLIEARERGLSQTIVAAEYKGQQWFYSNGRITKTQ